MRKLYNLADKLKAYFFLSFSTLVVLGLQAQNHDSGQMTAQPYNFSTFYKSNQASSHPYWNKFNVVGFQQHPEFGLLPHDAPCENCVEDYSKRTSNERYFIDIQDTFVFYQQTGYGDLNYWNGQYWLSIDHRLKFDEIKGLHAYYFANPLFLNPSDKSIEIEHNGLLLKFNNWKLYKSVDDQKIFLFEANWSEFTSGDDGVFVKNIFPGIDAEFIVMRGTVKTNFIINNIEGIGVFDQLIFEDQFSLKNGQTTRTIAHENSASKEFIGSFSIYDDQMHELVQYGEGLAYSKADPKNNSTSLIYQLSDESVAILVPSVWLLEQLQNSPVVIDPIVTGTNTLAQAAILGSMYNASCNFINSCNYNLTVAAPANAVFQNVTANFSYIAQGLCWMNEGAMRFTVGSCVSPNQAGFFWFCNQTGGGTCTGVNIPIYNDIAACLPAPACAPQNVTFTLQFFRSCWGTAGCNNNCIGAASAFSVTITGRTLEYSNQANPITVSATTICQGQSITASTTGLYGVAPYTYTWSFSPTGLPTIATGQSASINFPNTGTIYLYSVVTDACGNQIIASRIITVNAAPIVVASATNTTICQGQSTTISGSGGGATYTWNNGLGNSISHVVSPSVTTTYLVSSTVSGCPGSATLTITVSPNVTPTFAAVGPFCSGANIPALSTTSQNGITGTWAPAINNTATTTYTFTPTAGQCATTTTLTITINPNITPTFAAVGPFCSGANIPALPSTSLNGFTGTWAPAINNTATTNYTFTPTAGQCATTTTLTITINPNITPTFAAVGPFCSGANITALPTTSLNGYTGTWSPAINNTATTTYTFTPTAGQCATNTTLTITINTNVTPTFAAVGPFCIGANIPALPTTSLNGFTGTWSPAINNSATTSYTFTPTTGQCALATTMTITVNPNITPTFAAVGPFCSGANIPALPTTSLNGFTGTWAPAINNTTTTTYTFTPTAGQCATTNTLSITINPNITPTFAAVGPFCSGASIPALPTTSLNGFTGTWAPAINNTATTNYTFTPTAGQCATTTTLTITINPNITPTFAAVGPFCSGANITALPTTSLNGYTGSWAPAINNTATTTYTFTPTAGQCATNTTLTITINTNITPTFAAVGPFCSGANIPALPTTSLNGFTGTWSPAINNSATTSYTFTPTAGQCALATTMTITVNPNITPTFAAVGPYCSGANIPALPTTSLNGFTGTWAPAINNTATTTYTFTPTAGQCATTNTLSITINPNITPTFAAVGPFCSGASIPALPTTSLNGYTGTWAPAINNTATTTYTFTPTAGQCATTTTLTITINPNITPAFAAVGPFCSGANIPALPTTSLNGYTGTWAPAINNTATTTYTFTPTAGQCATNTTLTITINTNITPTFAAVGPFCTGANIPSLPTTSQNAISGTWAPAIDNTATTTYTFTPTAGQCATTTTLTITINPNITPTFSAVGPYCSGANIPALPTTSLNGFTGTWAPAINNTATTTYTFTPTAGQCATTTTLTITINPNITPTFAAVGPYCNGANIPALPTTSLNGYTGTWSPAIDNTATTTYTFTPTAGQCATTTNSSIIVNQPNQSITNYSICANNLPYQWNGLNIGSGGQHQVILTNAQGCDSVTLLNLTLIPVLTSTTNVTICANQAPYNWNGQLLSISGTATVTLTSSSGCDSLATLNLTVNPMPQVSFIANSAASCAPVQVTFTNTSGISGTCQWNLGNGIVSNSCGTVTGIYENFGCYDVTLQVTNNFECTSSLTQDDLICVDPEPIASFNVNPSTLSSFNPQAQFTNTSTGYSSQIWNFGDGSGGSNQNNPAHTYPEEAGQYYVTLVVSNSNGCLDSVTQLVIVENDVIYYIPNTFTPDDDLHNQTFKPIFTAGFDIYQYQMVILNRWGEIIFESNNAEVGWDGTFGGQLCQDGVYLWQITYKEIGRDKRNEIRGHVNLLR